MLPAFQSMRVTLPQHPTGFITLNAEHLDPDAWDSWMTLTKSLPVCDPVKGPWIAGGAVRRLFLGLDPAGKDVDYFFTSKEQFHIYSMRLESNGAECFSETTDHRTYDVFLPNKGYVHVQLVRTRFRESLEDHLNAFDFRFCQTGWNGREFIASVPAIHDLDDKVIRLNGTPGKPVSSWMRLLKYAEQGFRPHQDTVNALLDTARLESSDELPY